jgi:ABC-2 type transport system permease protein
VNGIVYRLVARRLLFRRRTLGLALLAVAACVPALGFRLDDNSLTDAEQFYAELLQTLFVPTVTAFIALVLGVSALGDEREDATILLLAATPLARVRIVASAVAAAWTSTLALVVPALLLIAWLALDDELAGRLVGWPLAAVTLAALAYTALAVWLSLLVRRPVVVGLLYILLWEGSIATFAASADKLSVAAYARALVARAAPDVPEVATPGISTTAAFAVLLLVGAAATWLGGRALRRTELP